MIRRKATPEKNHGKSVTLHVATRTPEQAFIMLRQGHPIDVTAGYYEDQGLISDDFWMLDTVGKLHRLAELRNTEVSLMSSIKEQELHLQTLKQKQDAEIDKAIEEAERISASHGKVSQPGAVTAAPTNGGSRE